MADERILTTEEVERIRNDKRPITRESMADVFETLETLRAERDRLLAERERLVAWVLREAKCFPSDMDKAVRESLAAFDAQQERT